ncbi:10578_t:CDS:2, partial [Gigaspora margarita]
RQSNISTLVNSLEITKSSPLYLNDTKNSNTSVQDNSIKNLSQHDPVEKLSENSEISSSRQGKINTLVNSLEITTSSPLYLTDAKKSNTSVQDNSILENLSQHDSIEALSKNREVSLSHEDNINVLEITTSSTLYLTDTKNSHTSNRVLIVAQNDLE